VLLGEDGLRNLAEGDSTKSAIVTMGVSAEAVGQRQYLARGSAMGSICSGGSALRSYVGRDHSGVVLRKLFRKVGRESTPSFDLWSFPGYVTPGRKTVNGPLSRDKSYIKSHSLKIQRIRDDYLTKKNHF